MMSLLSPPDEAEYGGPHIRPATFSETTPTKATPHNTDAVSAPLGRLEENGPLLSEENNSSLQGPAVPGYSTEPSIEVQRRNTSSKYVCAM